MLQTYISDLVTKEKENKTFLVKKKSYKNHVLLALEKTIQKNREKLIQWLIFKKPWLVKNKL